MTDTFEPGEGSAGRAAESGYLHGYLGPIERLVAHAAGEVRLLASLTPTNAFEDRTRLTQDLRAGRKAVPRWTYLPREHDRLRRALDAADGALERLADAPLAAQYQARVRELSLELALCAAAGTRDVARLARQRFPADARFADEASRLGDAWLESEAATLPEDPPMFSDDPDPRSLLSRMRAAVGEAKLPFAVVAQPALAPLAATGDRVILVASGRPVHDEDVERTVLHEVEGHAKPRARALQSPFALLRAGTARGVDDQEGRALLLEERAGLLGARRKRQLAARHRAVEAMLHGASFGDVANILKEVHGLDAGEAVVVAERAFRGGDGTHPGLGRERVYLEGFLRVRAHLAEHPADERLLGQGQVALGALDALRAHL